MGTHLQCKIWCDYMQIFSSKKKNPKKTLVKKGVVFKALNKGINHRLIKPAHEQDFKRDREGTHESIRSYNSFGAERG